MAEGAPGTGIDFATLGLEVDSTALSEFIQELVKLEDVSGQAEGATKKLDQAAQASAASSRQRAQGIAEETNLREQYLALRERETAQAQAEIQAFREMEQAQESADAAHRNFLQNRAANEKRAAAEAAAQSHARGRENALAEMKAAERVYREEVARIKQAQVEGLLTPQDAEQAGRESAMAFNRAMLETIRAGQESGALVGSRGAAAYTEIAGSLKNVDESGRRASIGLGRVNQSVASMAAQAAGAHPVVGRLASVVGSMALGTALTTGVLAGLAAIALGWRKITEDAREAEKELEAAGARLQALADQRRIRETEGGQTGIDVAGHRAELESIRAEIDRLQRQPVAVGPASLGGGAQDAAVRAARIQALEEQYRRLAALTREGEMEIEREREQAAEREKTRTDAESEQFDRRLKASRASLEALRIQVSEQDRLAAASRQGTEAFETELQAIERERAVREAGTAAMAGHRLETEALAGSLFDLTAETERQNAASREQAEADRRSQEAAAKKREAAEERAAAAVAEFQAERDALTRMLAARQEGTRAVEALEVALAGEAAARALGTEATDEQRAAVAAEAEATARARQEAERYNEVQKEAARREKELADARREAVQQLDRAQAQLQRGLARAARDVARSFGGAVEQTYALTSAIVETIRHLDALRAAKEAVQAAQLASNVGSAGGSFVGNIGAAVGAGGSTGLSTGQILGAALPIVGGIAGVVSGIIGRSDEHRRQLRQARRAYEDALDDFVDGLTDRDRWEQMQKDAADRAAALFEQLQASIGGEITGDLKDLLRAGDIEGFNAELQKLLESMRNTGIFKGLADAFGAEAAKILETYLAHLERIEEQRQAEIAAMTESYQVQRLRLLGMHEEADALQRDIDLRQALKDAMGDSALENLIREVYELRKAADEAAEAAKREAAAKERADRTRDFGFDLESLKLRNRGDDQGLFELELKREQERMRAHAAQLLEDKVITPDEFLEYLREIAKLGENELRRYADAIRETEEAAKAAAEAERFRQMRDTESLRVQVLRLQGDEAGARALEKHLEILAAVEAGRGAEYIRLLQTRQALQDQRAAAERAKQATDDLTRSFDEMYRVLNRPSGFRLELLHYEFQGQLARALGGIPAGGGGGLQVNINAGALPINVAAPIGGSLSEGDLHTIQRQSYDAVMEGARQARASGLHDPFNHVPAP